MINNYNYQKEANISCLLDDREYAERKDVFWRIIKEFTNQNIGWGIGCSMNLFLRGIVDEFHDFDLIVEGKDISNIKEIMENIGGKLLETGGNGFCESEMYLHYQVGRVDVDIISGFRVKTFETEFIYRFDFREIENCIIYEETKISIPMIPAEALYVLYCMMEGWQPRRRYKRILIQEYLREHMSFRNILENALNSDLPNWIKRNLRELLESS